MNLALVSRKTIEQGGFSMSLKGRIPKKGYAVSIYPQFSEVCSPENLREKLREFVRKNQGLLKKRNRFLGTWMHAGEVYLDISATYKRRQYAMWKARKAFQQAIYSFDEGELSV